MDSLVIYPEGTNRDISINIDDNDTIEFTYYDRGDTDSTYAIKACELFNILKYKPEERLKAMADVKLAESIAYVRDLYAKELQKSKQLQEINNKLASERQTLKDALKLIGKK